jgi:hypothetical protein
MIIQCINICITQINYQVLVPPKNGLEPLKFFEPLNGVIFTTSHEKGTQYQFNLYNTYGNDVPCHVEQLHNAAQNTNFGRQCYDNHTGSWYLVNFAPPNFNTIEPGLQFYVAIPSRISYFQ